MRLPLHLVLLAVSFTACATSPPAAAEAALRRAHEHFVATINSNDVDRLLALCTDDFVMLAPESPPMIGKDALRPWLAGYVAAFETRWEKRIEELVVCGSWAFERYSYSHLDTPRAGGEQVRGTGWGLLVWRLEPDGSWRIARDAWGSDRPGS
jgi:ketosteroid isomerase-like protein